MPIETDTTNINTTTTAVILGSAVVGPTPCELGSIDMTSGRGSGGAAGAVIGSVMIVPQPAAKALTDEVPHA